MSIRLLSILLIGMYGSDSVLVGESSTWGLDFTYHDNKDIGKFFRDTVKFYPNFTEVYSIGSSVNGQQLLVLKLSAPVISTVGTPHVKLIGNIHGNEPVGKELILNMIQYMLRHYPDDLEVQTILNTTVIHFLPNMNPDGGDLAREGDCMNGPGRRNSHGIDLNRNFPDKFGSVVAPRQPETQAIINWMQNHTFMLSASMHGGTKVVNYPLDNIPQTPTMGVAAASADDDVFEHLAHTYADNHETLYRGNACANTRTFPGGITRGASWYRLTGGMQDYNYFEHGCMELTLELSCCKYPLAQNLTRLWKENRQALLEFIKKANQGLRGQVLSAETGKPISNASLHIDERNVPFSTSKNGEFWRFLLPGNYLLKIHVPGYYPQVHPVTVSKHNYTEPSSTWISVYLKPIKQVFKNAAGSIHSRHRILLKYLLIIVVILMYIA